MINIEDLRCPCKNRACLEYKSDILICADSNCIHNSIENGFPIVEGQPIIISEILCDTAFNSREIDSKVERRKRSKLRGMFLGKPRVTEECCELLISEMCLLSNNPRVLVIGGGQIGGGMDALYKEPKILLTSVDVYRSNTTDIVCDGHYLPFRDESFDGVWIQAVLEHVIDPVLVVSEIHRVLKRSGLVYAETPFMQQVHEGAYDYTRYTVLGHRYLFRNFSLLKIGGIGGPEVSLAWSVKYFIWGLTRSQVLAKISGFSLMTLLRLFSFITSKHALYDSSFVVYFLGRKSNRSIRQIDLPKLYGGLLK